MLRRLVWLYTCKKCHIVGNRMLRLMYGLVLEISILSVHSQYRHRWRPRQNVWFLVCQYGRLYNILKNLLKHKTVSLFKKRVYIWNDVEITLSSWNRILATYRFTTTPLDQQWQIHYQLKQQIRSERNRMMSKINECLFNHVYLCM